MGIFDTIQEESTFSKGSGISYQYVVLQVTLKEKFIGTGSGNLTELEKVINEQAAKGYRLHTISTTSSGSKGLLAATVFRQPWYLKSWADKLVFANASHIFMAGICFSQGERALPGNPAGRE